MGGRAGRACSSPRPSALFLSQAAALLADHLPGLPGPERCTDGDGTPGSDVATSLRGRNGSLSVIGRKMKTVEGGTDLHIGFWKNERDSSDGLCFICNIGVMRNGHEGKG